MLSFAYRLTGPTGTRNGRGVATIEREARALAYTTAHLGEVRLEVALSGGNLATAINALTMCHADTPRFWTQRGGPVLPLDHRA